MTTSRKRTGSADGARVETRGGAAVFVCGTALCRARTRRIHRALRWKKDAVCRETAAADTDSDGMEMESISSVGAGSAGSSITRTIFFTSRIQTQTQTRKETPNTTQKKKGKQNQNAVTIRKKLVTLA